MRLRHARWLVAAAVLAVSSNTSESKTIGGTVVPGGDLPTLYSASQTFSCTLKPPVSGTTLARRHHLVARIDPQVAEVAHLTGVGVEVTLTTKLTTTTQTVWMEVGYDPTDAPGRRYVDQQVLTFDDYDSVSAVVTSVHSTAGVTPANVVLDLECERELVRDLAGPVATVHLEQDAAGDDITIWWDPVVGAEHYDVQWTWIGSENGAGSSIPLSSLFIGDRVDPGEPYPNSAWDVLPTDLAHDASRARVNGTRYVLPDLYEDGWLVARVRPIGKGGPDATDEILGAWEPALAPGWTPLSDFDAKLNLAGHEEQLNWQWSASFAEGGKRNDRVSYHDGALMGRQQVSKVNSDENVVVAETVYDHAGRPAIQVLPVPVAPEVGTTIRHYPGFNLDSGGDPYDLDAFDRAEKTCDAPAEPMATTSGASRYYSPSTPTFPDKPWQGYVPDAGGYPFVQVEYARDPTGRVRRQGGVGDTFRIGAGHETELGYGVAAQASLTALFGAEAGNAGRFQRRLASDANGQIAVSYVDPAGRVVASALAGDPPEALETIADVVGQLLTEDLTGVGNGVDGDSRVLSRTINVTTEQAYGFSYAHPPTSYRQACDADGTCYECVYDVEISLTDDCGAEMLAGGAKSATIGDPSTPGQDDTCSAAAYALDFASEALPVGAYTLTKTLTVNEDAITAATLAALADPECAPSLADFTLAAEAQIDVACGYDCEACQAELAAFSAVGLTAEEYAAGLAALQAECDDLCAPVADSCSALHDAMIADLTPGGQYAVYEDANGLNLSADPLSIFHPVTLLSPSASGGKIDWDSLAPSVGKTPEELIPLWDEAMSESLITFHPEYGLYAWSCIDRDLSASDDFDLLLLETDAIADALAWLPSPQVADPWFVSGASQASHVQKELDAFQCKEADPNLCVPLNPLVWWSAAELATGLANCPNDLLCADGDVNTDAEWSFFRSFYLSAKQRVLFRDRRNAAMFDQSSSAYGAYSGCIGNDDFLLTDYGFCSATPTAGDPCLEPTQTCAYAELDWLQQNGLQGAWANKQPRFMDVQTLPGNVDLDPQVDFDPQGSTDAMLASTEQWIWDNCHTCAAEYELRAFHTALADGGLLLGDTVAETVAGWSVGLAEDMKFGDDVEVHWAASAAGDTLSGYFYADVADPDGTTAERRCDLTLRLPDAAVPTWSWEDVLTVVSLEEADPAFLLTSTFTSTFDFALTVQVPGATATDPPVTLVAEGATNCFRPDACVAAAEAATDPCQAPAPNLVENGDFGLSYMTGNNPQLSYTFDCPDVREWTLTGPSSGGCGGGAGCSATLPDHTDPTSTSRFLLVGPNGKDPKYNDEVLTSQVLWQRSVIAQPGVVYSIGAWVMDADEATWGAAPEVWIEVDGVDVASVQLGEIPGLWLPVEGGWQFAGTASAPVTVSVVAYTGTGDPTVGWGAIGVDDVTFTDAACDPSPLCSVVEGVTVPFIDTCELNADAHVAYNAQQAWEQESLTYAEAFRAAYVAACLADVEQFTMTWTEQEGHYTLYRYDRAGNLTHTVPPAGIEADDPEHPRMQTTYAYDSLNALVRQVTPDAGQSCFWYDDVGRLRFSQNAEQIVSDRYSYSKYDALGRVVEVGQVVLSDHPATSDEEDGLLCDAERFTAAELNDPAWAAGVREHVTTTIYDAAPDATLSATLFGDEVRNLRGRVVMASIEAVDDGDPATWDSASHYAYDAQGNVKILVKDVPALDRFGHRFSTVRYDYDVISGKVNEVAWQPDQLDELRHKYTYDADNRIERVETSDDGVIWNVDARYGYYAHGPVARVVLGNVQGLDYTYTVQGWIKGMNSDRLEVSADPGGDDGTKLAADQAGFVLDYFPGDYLPAHTNAGAKLFEAALDGEVGERLVERPLYNGNISQWVMAVRPLIDADGGPTRVAYKYDALNRLLESTQFEDNKGTVKADSKWLAVQATDEDSERLTYDANGNIRTLRRTGPTDPLMVDSLMDDLTYTYAEKQPGAPLSNRLYHLIDAQTDDNRFTVDLDHQDPPCDPLVNPEDCNYGYDAIGNLVRDDSEDIAQISWTPYGKVGAVKRTTASTKPNLAFGYDEGGNKLFQRTEGAGETWYLRDAQGNVMAVYEAAEEQTCPAATVALVVSGAPGSVVSVLVDGVDPAGFPVWWVGSDGDTAAAFAAAVNAHTSAPDYVASANGGTVTISVKGGGTTGNGLIVAAGPVPSGTTAVPLSGTLSGGSKEGCTTAEVLRLAEHAVYGSARLGMRRPGRELARIEGGVLTSANKPTHHERARGETAYELTNHLGNVLAVVSDRRTATGSGAVIANGAEVLDAREYYPFGMAVVGRGGAYRWGFNGKEAVDGEVYDYGFRMMDARVGRFWGVDPLAARFSSLNLAAYAHASNGPTWRVDDFGLADRPSWSGKWDPEARLAYRTVEYACVGVSICVAVMGAPVTGGTSALALPFLITRLGLMAGKDIAIVNTYINEDQYSDEELRARYNEIEETQESISGIIVEKGALASGYSAEDAKLWGDLADIAEGLVLPGPDATALKPGVELVVTTFDLVGKGQDYVGLGLALQEHKDASQVTNGGIVGLTLTAANDAVVSGVAKPKDSLSDAGRRVESSGPAPKPTSKYTIVPHDGPDW
jgi:RHS repeat-associated protein